MTTEQKVQVIAEYDGWKYHDKSEVYRPNGYWTLAEVRAGWWMLEDMDYLTSMAWLHPVAMKVLDELKAIKGELSHSGKVVNACSEPPVNGEYIDLFNAVYDGIEFLNQHK